MMYTIKFAMNFCFIFRGILVPGGFGLRGTEGKLQAITWARERKVPFLGTVMYFIVKLK